MSYEPSTVNISKPIIIVRQQNVADEGSHFIDLKMLDKNEFIIIKTKTVNSKVNIFLQMLKIEELGFKAKSSPIELNLPAQAKQNMNTLKKMIDTTFHAAWQKPVQDVESYIDQDDEELSEKDLS